MAKWAGHDALELRRAVGRRMTAIVDSEARESRGSLLQVRMHGGATYLLNGAVRARSGGCTQTQQLELATACLGRQTLARLLEHRHR